MRTGISTAGATHPLFGALFEELEARGVDWCLLRGGEELDSLDGDLDLLVAPHHLDRLRGVLDTFGFVPVPAWGCGSHRAFVAYEAGEDRWAKVDVVTRIDFGRRHELRTGAAAAVLERRGRQGPVRAAAPEDAFWALLLHCLLDDRSIGRHGSRLRELAAVATLDSPLARRVWSADRLLACARTGAWDELLAVAPELGRRWAWRRAHEAVPLAAVNRVLRKLSKLQVALRRRGLSVALLGPDGAGKSTLAEGLVASFYHPVRSLYGGLYPAGSGTRRPRGLRLVRQLSRLRSRELVARWHRARGRLVIFDRHPYDALSARPGLARRSRLRRRLLARSCSAPDLVVLLDLAGEDAFARKGEHSPEALEKQRRRYRELASRLPSVVTVDAGREADEVRRLVTALVWRRYAAHRRVRRASHVHAHGGVQVLERDRIGMADGPRGLALEDLAQQRPLSLVRLLEHGARDAGEGEAELAVVGRQRRPLVLEGVLHPVGDLDRVHVLDRDLGSVVADHQEEAVEGHTIGGGGEDELRWHVGTQLPLEQRQGAAGKPPEAAWTADARGGVGATGQQRDSEPVAAPDPLTHVWKLAQMPVPEPHGLGDPVHAAPAGGDVDPLVAHVRGTVRREGEQRLSLAALRPAGRDDADPFVQERGGVQRQHAVREHGEIEDRDQERHRGQSALADDFDLAADSVERELDARGRLVPAAQDEEGVVGEGGVVQAEVAETAAQRQPVDEAEDDVGLPSERAPELAELPTDGGDVPCVRVDQPDPSQPVEVEIDQLVVGGGHGERRR